MSTILLIVRAGENTVFGSSAFDGAIGRSIPLTGVGPGWTATLVSAQIIEDGAAAQLNLECDEETARHLGLLGVGIYSFGFDPRDGLRIIPVEAKRG